MLKDVAYWYTHTFGSNLPILSAAITVCVGLFTSAFDNVLAAAATLPLLEGLKYQGVNVQILYWVLLFAACIWGSLSQIGSTVNIQICEMLKKANLITEENPMTLLVWWKSALLPTVAQIITYCILLALFAALHVI